MTFLGRLPPLLVLLVPPVKDSPFLLATWPVAVKDRCGADERISIIGAHVDASVIASDVNVGGTETIDVHVDVTVDGGGAGGAGG